MKRTLRNFLVLLATTALIAGLFIWSFRSVSQSQNYACGVCDYVYSPSKPLAEAEGLARPLFAELPEDWHCPSCGAAKSAFKPITISSAFRRARWELVALSFFCMLAVFLIKAWRWQVILMPTKRVRMRPLISAIMIGFMVNSIYSRLGEVMRAVVLRIKGELKTTPALASIALERVFDLFSVILFLAIAILCVNPAESGAASAGLTRVRKAGVVFAALFVTGVAFLVFLRLHKPGAIRLVKICVLWLPRRFKNKATGFIENFMAEMDTLKGPRHVAAICALSILHWGMHIAFFYFAGRALPDLGLTVPGAMLVFAVTALGVAALPLPGYLGVFPAGVTAAGIILGLPAAAVFSYSWLAWAVNIPPIILIGFGFLWAEGLSLSQLQAGTRATG